MASAHTPPKDAVPMTLEEVHALATKCLVSSGANAENARAVADIVTAAERDICASHGLFRIPGYCASLKSGKVNGNSSPTASRIAPAVVRVEGQGGFAPLALEVGRAPLIEAAREQGVAALAVRDIHHFAALWPETQALAEEGLVGFAFTAALPYVVAAGGRKPIFGTNPMSFAWPRPGKDPMVFDQASSTLARGDIMIAKRDGHAVPLGTGVDKDGNDTTDPGAILDGGAQLTFGGYKGSAIAMMVELLAGALIGDLFSFESKKIDIGDGGPPRGGEFMLAIDPARLGDADGWAAHAEALFAEMISDDGVRLPADRRHANRKLTPTEGAHIPRALYEKLVEIAG